MTNKYLSTNLAKRMKRLIVKGLLRATLMILICCASTRQNLMCSPPLDTKQSDFGMWNLQNQSLHWTCNVILVGWYFLSIVAFITLTVLRLNYSRNIFAEFEMIGSTLTHGQLLGSMINNMTSETHFLACNTRAISSTVLRTRMALETDSGGGIFKYCGWIFTILEYLVTYLKF